MGMNMMVFAVLILLLLSVNAYVRPLSRRISTSSLSLALNADALSKLEDMKARYDRLSNVVSPESEAEMKSIEDVVEKYTTLKEIKIMLGKLRTMWRSEASERRRAKQLKSFLQLYKGRVEIEEIIAEKLSITIDKEEQSIGLDEVERLDAKIKKLEGALKKEEIKMPQGMSTREARFGALP
jgi:hypothetical protein